MKLPAFAAPVAEAKAAIAAGSQSFAAAAKLMPAAIRDDTVVLYAWCRYADGRDRRPEPWQPPPEGRHDPAAGLAGRGGAAISGGVPSPQLYGVILRLLDRLTPIAARRWWDVPICRGALRGRSLRRRGSMGRSAPASGATARRPITRGSAPHPPPKRG